MFTKSILQTAISLTISTASFAQNNSTMKSINSNAAVQCSKTITIKASSEKVWSVMTNINNWANWQTEISNPKLNDELKPAATFDWKTGGAKIHSTLHTVEPFKNFGWTGKTFGMFAIHNWTIVAQNGQTVVSVDESMEGFLARLFKKSFNKILRKEWKIGLSFLKRNVKNNSKNSKQRCISRLQLNKLGCILAFQLPLFDRFLLNLATSSWPSLSNINIPIRQHESK